MSTVKYNKEKKDSLLGETIVVLKEVNESGEETSFQVEGNPRGVEIRGNSSTFATLGDLDKFAKAVDSAWRAHQELKPKIVTNLSGH